MTHHIPKVTKQDCILSSAPKHTNVANFQWSIAKKLLIFTIKISTQTDRLTFSFVMVSETWWWYYRFGRGASFP